jgi:hypothetical protein
MKKFLAAMFACTLAFTTCFAVVGCGGGDDAETPAAEPGDTAEPDSADGAGEEGAEDTGEGEGESA